MILTRDEYQILGVFLNENRGTDLATFAVTAWDVYSGFSNDLDSYVVIRVGEYYAITKIFSEWVPIEVSEWVRPFDKNGIYPLQRIQKKIEWAH